MTAAARPTPVMLAILDGWGYSEGDDHNAIAAAHKPTWDALLANHPNTFIDTSGLSVGLPEGQMGNSEVGHLTLGSGRVIYQDYTRITKAIADGDFMRNDNLVASIDAAVAVGRAVHIMGLLSPGGVHSHESHIHAAIELAAARGAKNIFVHAFLDGRDMPPRSAEPSLAALEKIYAKTGVGRTASLIGRYYAMDRDQRWERVQAAYDLITTDQAAFTAENAAAGLAAAYARDENDEFVQATQIGDTAALQDGDALIFMNYRADRARQITQSFIDPDFDGFTRTATPVAHMVCLTQYHADFDVPVAFAPQTLPNVLGEYVSDQGLKQLRAAETEKYAHVTFFFNGGIEKPFTNETRELIPSPDVATYDLQPEMNAPALTDALVAAIESGDYDLIICNYANPDMVGHTGNFNAAVKAIEAIDQCLARITAALDNTGGELLITADHGNVEQMHDTDTGQAHTAHTTNKVPLIYRGRAAQLTAGGSLADIAPTLLHLLNLPAPAEMTGTSLINFTAAAQTA